MCQPGRCFVTEPSVQAPPGQEARPQKFHARAPVHLSPARLEPIDMTFHRAVAPRFGHRAFHRVEVAAKRPDKPLHGVNVGGVRTGHPAVRRNVSLSQDRAETQHQAPHPRKARTLGLQHVDRPRLAPAADCPSASTTTPSGVVEALSRCNREDLGRNSSVRQDRPIPRGYARSPSCTNCEGEPRLSLTVGAAFGVLRLSARRDEISPARAETSPV